MAPKKSGTAAASAKPTAAGTRAKRVKETLIDDVAGKSDSVLVFMGSTAQHPQTLLYHQLVSAAGAQSSSGHNPSTIVTLPPLLVPLHPSQLMAHYLRSSAPKPAAKKTAPKSTTTKAAPSKPAGGRKSVGKAVSVPASSKKPVAKPAAKRTANKRSNSEVEDADAEPDRSTKRSRTAEPKAAAAKPRKVAKPKTIKAPKARPVINEVPTVRENVYVFGDGSSGELGFGAAKKATDVKRPRLNPLLDAKTVGVVGLAAGGMHSVALTHDHKILTWGVNDNGALGRDTAWSGGLRDVSDDNDDDSDSDEEDPGLELNPKESLPTEVDPSAFPSGTKFVQIAAGDSCSFAVTDEGLVYGWGTFRDDKGIFGFALDKNNKVIKQQNTPILIEELKNIKQIECGENHAIALDNKGAVYAWGCGQQDQLGRRLVQRHAEQNLHPTPLHLPKHGKVVTIAAGPNHSFAVGTNGEVWAWGLNSFAQTGIPYADNVDNDIITGPTKVASLKDYNIKMMAAGGQHSLALTEDGTTLAFGRMDNFALGLDFASLPVDDPEAVRKDEKGSPRILFKPSAVPIPAAAFIACGIDHNIAITPEGKAYSWGFNDSYQCGQGEEENVKVPKLIDNTAVREVKLVWAGCGGQFSMISSDATATARS
jgi:regulator of chromosome condensation